MKGTTGWHMIGSSAGKLSHATTSTGQSRTAAFITRHLRGERGETSLAAATASRTTTQRHPVRATHIGRYLAGSRTHRHGQQDLPAHGGPGRPRGDPRQPRCAAASTRDAAGSPAVGFGTSAATATARTRRWPAPAARRIARTRGAAHPILSSPAVARLEVRRLRPSAKPARRSGCSWRNPSSLGGSRELVDVVFINHPY